MDKRRVITSAVVVATVGAATALTLPAIAGTDKNAPGNGSSAAPEVSSDMMAALRRDLNLTAAQAQTRLSREAWAIRTTNALRREMGSSWAGAWLNAEASQLTVAVTDPDQVDEIRTAGAVPKVVTRSAARLNSMKQALDRRAGAAASSIPGWYVDPASNSVVVLTRSDNTAAVRRFVSAAGLSTDAIRVKSTTEAPKLLLTPPGPGQDDDGQDNGAGQEQGGQEQGGQADPSAEPGGQEGDQQAPPANAGAQPLIGGSAYFIDNVARCSVGFAVEGGFLSAGHCGQEGDDTAALAGNQAAAQGTFEASSFPVDDFSFVATNQNFAPTGEVDSFNGETTPNGGGANGLAASGENLPVAGSQAAPVGTSVCKFGSTSGASCGVIEALNATAQVADPEGGNGVLPINGLIRTDVCAEGGDSGGPLLAGDQAQGVVSSGSGDCADGGITFFQPVNEILERLDKTLILSAGQGQAGQNEAGQNQAGQNQGGEDQGAADAGAGAGADQGAVADQGEQAGQADAGGRQQGDGEAAGGGGHR